MNNIIKLIDDTKKSLTRYDYENVIENCDKILEIDSASGFALRFKAIAYFQLEEYEKAIEIYTKLSKIFPEDEELPYTLAYMYECLGKYNESLHYLERCKEDSVVDSKKKRLLTKMGLYNQIINEYDLRLKQLSQDNPSTDEQILKMQLLEEKAIFLFRSGEYNKAYNLFYEVKSIYSLVKNKSYLIEKVAEWYDRLFSLMDKYSDKEFFNNFLSFDKKSSKQWNKRLEYQYAIIGDPLVYCDFLLEDNPDNNNVLRSSAKISKYMDYDYSLECWNKLLEIEPENTEVIKEILHIYSNQYSKDRSLKLIDSKLHIESLKIYLLKYKIQLLESMTLYDDALEIYDEYLSMKDDALSTLTVYDKIRCMELKALHLYKDNKVYQSYTLYNEILMTFMIALDNNQFKRKPGIDTVKWYTAVLQEALNKSDDNPLIFFEELFKINEDTFELWQTKIFSFIISNRYINSINVCNILLEENPNNIQLLLTKAEVYSRTSTLAKSYDLYNKVLELDSDNNEAKNKKFVILVKWEEYEKAYNLLKTMKIASSSKDDLNKLANKFFSDKEYDKALYCYNLMGSSYWGIINKIKYIWQETDDTVSQNESKYYMDWIKIINFKYDDVLCPECNSKLIPIMYGLPVMDENEEEKIGVDYVLGGCCVSIDSPSHYCKHCDKCISFGPYGIDITMDDYELYIYTSVNINAFVRIVENKKTRIDNIVKSLYSNGIDEKECSKFIEKLESISFITVEDDVVTLVEGYDKFNNNLM